MATMSESRTLHFGLRDFLFYLVPGFTVLAAVVLAAGIGKQALADFTSVGGSVAAILLAYLIGQVSYGFAYPLRRLIKAKGTWAEEDSAFRNAYMWLIEKHTAFYTAEVFRYRNFARFSIAMVLPSFLLGVAAAVRLWCHSAGWSCLAALGGIAAVIVFVTRYKRYTSVFRDQVFRCWSFDWASHAETGAPEKRRD